MPTRWDSDVEIEFKNVTIWGHRGREIERVCVWGVCVCVCVGGGTAAWAFDFVSRFHYNSKLVLQQFLVYQDWSYSSIELL